MVLNEAKSADTALKLNMVSLSFGGLKAVTDFSFELRPTEICGLIGPNGAGKTTLFNLITGVYPPDGGEISLGQERISGLPPNRITKLGVARTFQNIRLFSDLSVLQNVMVSYHQRQPYALWTALARNRHFYEKEAEMQEQATSLLDIFELGSRKDEMARNLSYGDQRCVEIARALATKPKVLLLDEPAAGLNSGEKVELMKIVANIRRDFNVSILIIEHDMKLVMGVCERIVVLDHGEMIADGTPKAIQENPRVIEAYLGVA